MVQPIDQGSILRSGAELIPDISAQILRERLLGIQQQEAQTNQAQEQRLLSRQTQEQQRRTSFEQATANLGPNPTTRQLAELMYRYPEFSEAVNRGFNAMDTDTRRREFQALSEITAAARGGRFDLAAATLRRRVEADREAGQEPDPMDTAILTGLESEDRNERQFAVDMLERSTSAVDPERYSQTYGTFQRQTREVDGIIYDEQTGEPLFQSPYARVIAGPDGSFFEVPRVSSIPVLGGRPAGVGTQSEGAPASGGSGSGGARGSGRSRGERNNNEGNIEDGNFARSQPGYQGSDGRFARFDTPENGRRAQENLLRRNYVGMTLGAAINRYAPASENGPSTSNYLAYVARQAGLRPGDRLTNENVGRVAAAMREFETGNRSSGGGSGGQPVRVRSRQQYEQLASGSEYIAPDGSRRRKP